MFRKLVLAGLSVTLAFGGIAIMSDSTGAAKPTITATGNVQCNISGKVKISPPLSDTNPSPSTITGKVKGDCTGSTEGGVTPTKVKIGISYTTSGPGTCGGLAQPGVDPFTFTMSWKGSGGKINPSTATLKGFVLTGVPSFGFSLPNPSAPSPRSTVTGSYAGTENASAFASIDLPDTTLCSDSTKPNGKVQKAKGIKKIPIKPGSTLTIS